MVASAPKLGGRFGFFPRRGRGTGSPRHHEGGGGIGFFLFESPRRGGRVLFLEGGAEGPGGCLWGIGGGGLNIFFRGRNSH